MTRTTAKMLEWLAVLVFGMTAAYHVATPVAEGVTNAFGNVAAQIERAG